MTDIYIPVDSILMVDVVERIAPPAKIVEHYYQIFLTDWRMRNRISFNLEIDFLIRKLTAHDQQKFVHQVIAIDTSFQQQIRQAMALIQSFIAHTYHDTKGWFPFACTTSPLASFQQTPHFSPRFSEENLWTTPFNKLPQSLEDAQHWFNDQVVFVNYTEFPGLRLSGIDADPVTMKTVEEVFQNCSTLQQRDFKTINVGRKTYPRPPYFDDVFCRAVDERFPSTSSSASSTSHSTDPPATPTPSAIISYH